MSKTFKSNHPDNKVLKVDDLFGNPRLLIKDFDGDTRGFVYAPSDAPALALAILEAAGHGGSSDSSCLMQAFDLIELHVKEQERATAEAEAKAELEAEALELRNTWNAKEWERVNEFSDLLEPVQKKWLAVARKAREMAKEATK